MKIFLFVTIVTFLVSIIDVAAWNSIQFCDNDYSVDIIIGQVVELQRRFSLNLYKLLMKQSNDTVSFVTCPLATWLGLSKIYFGSRGLTREQLQYALDLPVSCLAAQLGYQDIAYQVKMLNAEVSSLRLVNDIYYDSELNLQYDFLKLMDTGFSTTALPFDFQGVNASAKFIKKVAATFGHQPNVAAEMKETDSLVIVDTGAFLMEWKATDEECLYGSNGYFYHLQGYEMHEFVSNIADSIYGKTDVDDVPVAYVAIPLEDTSQNGYLMVILPDETDDFSKVERGIDENMIRSMLLDGLEVKVHVTLPIFDIATSIDITENLRQMAFNAAFDKDADLKGIARNQIIRVNRVLHNARVQLTKRCGFTECPKEEMIHFNGDHAFIFAIVSTSSQPIVLLIGRYTGKSP